MSNEIETVIKTSGGLRIDVSEWDEGGAWICLGHRHGDIHGALTRAEAQQLMAGLQAILAKEVAA